MPTHRYLPYIFLILLTITCAYQQIPLRKDQYGISVGDKQGDLHIQFFLDFICQDSKQAYDTIMKVMDEMDFYQQGIKLTYQFSPLSWHFFSVKINQALFFIMEKVGAQQADKFIAYVLSHQEDFTQEKWFNKKISQFLDYFVETISGVIKIDKAQFRSELNQGESWNTVRYHWKYSVGTHSVFGTPTFNLNSVKVDGAQNFTADQWIDLLGKFKNSKPVKHMTVDLDNLYLDFASKKDRN